MTTMTEMPAPRDAMSLMGATLHAPEDKSGHNALVAAGLYGWDTRVLPFGVLDPVTGEPASSTEVGLSTVVRTNPKTGMPQILGGAVTGKYRAIDPYTAFHNMSEALIHEHLVAEAGGSYGTTPGQFAFMSFRLPKEVVVGGDKVMTRLLLHVENTGRGALTAVLHRMRLGCSNEIRRLKGTAEVKWSLQHSSKADDLDARIIEARTMLGLVELADERFEAQVQAMMEREQTAKDFEAIVTKVMGERPIESGRGQTRYDNTVESIWEARNDESVAEFRDTAWGTYNAFTFWDQHLRSAKGGDAGRATRTMFGPTIEDKVLTALTPA